ncbi:MAG: hypothetical protein ABSF22_04280 [Bryobacteraceae bacterium]
MRVPDHVLKCVGYVAEFLTSDSSGEDYELEGSGFFIGVPCLTIPDLRFHYFATAAHVVRGLDPERTKIIVNHKNGTRTVITPPEWYFHDDPSVDAAVMPYINRPAFDTMYVGTELFLSSEKMKERMIGIGDDVFFPGLFQFAPGTKQNHPILRHGNIAMLPETQIQMDAGFAHVYLVEARSIGGISGSPVFTRETVSLETRGADTEKGLIIGIGNKFHLLGMARSHWDLNERDINSYSGVQDRPRGVNMGIAAVTPAGAILEILNQAGPALARAEAERKHREDISPGFDGVE